MSKAVSERPEPAPISGWQAREMAPSSLRDDEPRVARFIGMVGLMFLVLGSMALMLVFGFHRANPLIGVGWGSTFAVVGLVGLLFHAANDKDLQIRRTYLVLGFVWLAAGALLFILAMTMARGDFFGWGIPSLVVALVIVLASLRHETEEDWRRVSLLVIGGTGAILALAGFIGSNINRLNLMHGGDQGSFLVPYGFVLALLGLAYACAFVGMRGTADDLGYRGGLVIGVVGLIVFLIALLRSTLPPLFYSWHWMSSAPNPYLIPTGMLLMCLGLLYLLFATGLCSENNLVVMTRRELAAFFYSPIAYVVLFGFMMVGWWEFLNLLVGIIQAKLHHSALIEPIVRDYLVDWWPMIAIVFIVPVLTMRLLAEEKRMGTLEVLLTAPVTETSIVLSKFFGGLLFFLFLWLPFALFLVALRIGGGQPFDYRPLISFLFALVATGAAFISMGLFFSSLTRNQIASAVATFVGMIAFFAIFFAKRTIEHDNQQSHWIPVLKHASFVDLWLNALDGNLVLQYLVFYLSLTVLWLFLTVKVLDARRWS